MTKVGKKQMGEADSKKLHNKKPISYIPSQVVAEVVGVSKRHVNHVRAGKRGKYSMNAGKIKFADKFLQKEFEKLIIRAKAVVS